MSEKSNDIIASLRNNLKRIIQLYEAQKDENRQLREQVETIGRQLTLLQKEKRELETKHSNTNLASAFVAAAGSNHDAKIKVNRIVREIDKCIALLNK